MRRSRRGGQGGLEFGGSGEDSFVAVVVTKLTGALLFILLLTMVIMALLPKAVDLPSTAPAHAEKADQPLRIETPDVLPEAIVGHPYVLTLAATGGVGPRTWSLDGALPDGLTFDPETARLAGTPRAGTATPALLTFRVRSGSERASQTTRLVVYQSDQPLTTPAWWKPGLPPIPWRAWLEQGVGFLLLWLVHLVSLNALASLERWSLAGRAPEIDSEEERPAIRRRFLLYRVVVWIATLGATVGLAAWLWGRRG